MKLLSSEDQSTCEEFEFERQEQRKANKFTGEDVSILHNNLGEEGNLKQYARNNLQENYFKIKIETLLFTHTYIFLFVKNFC